MFLCRVTVGAAMETTEADVDGLPPLTVGFDSLHAKAGPHLNYDERVVYSEQAAIPSYLIVYSLPV